MFRRSLIIATLALAAFALFATFGTSDDAEAQGPPLLSLPANAVEVAPDVFSIGVSRVDGVLVEGFVFLDRAHPGRGGIPGPPDGNGGGGGNNDPAASCYSFIFGSQVNWQNAEPWALNPTNQPFGAGTTSAQIAAVLQTAMAEWDGEVAADIFGGYAGTNGISTNNSGDANTVFFGDFDQSGVIAATWVWRTIGPPQTRQIVAWDMIVDLDWDWSMNGTYSDPSKLDVDFLNVMTHEIGHAAGMGHTEEIADCAMQSMYPRILSANETIKRDIDVGDRAGIKVLY